MESNSKFAHGAQRWTALFLLLFLAAGACGTDDGGGGSGGVTTGGTSTGGLDATGGTSTGGMDATGGATGGAITGGSDATGGAISGGVAESGGMVTTGCMDGFADLDSGLCWEAEAMTTSRTHAEAISYCETFSAGGEDDFRLPTVSELRTLIRDCPSSASGGSCPVGPSALDSTSYETTCAGCDATATCYWPAELGGPCTLYWSTSEVSDYPAGEAAWFVSFNRGSIAWEDASSPFYARCVRDL